ncbi:MAG TPA: molybdenum cofactor biosynthesis protein MoaD [Bacteroidetes bacterium]|nr:molybdenum cofactor biosynthesis protein MoaD [Bacteroidota bacterium]
MPTIKFTHALKRFYPDLASLVLQVNDVRQAIEEIDKKYLGIKSYILDDHGALRQHVNVFIDGQMIKDRETLSDRLQSDSEVYIMQALSGG